MATIGGSDSEPIMAPAEQGNDENDVSVTNLSWCQVTRSVFKDEFRLKNFGLCYHRQDVFYTSQWPIPRMAFLIYRLCLATYCVVIIILSITGFDGNSDGKKWIIFLTHWGYTVITFHLVLAAIIAVLFSRGRPCCESTRLPKLGNPRQNAAVSPNQRNLQSSPKWYMKLDWVLFILALVLAPVITMVYFIALYPQRQQSGMTIPDINLHLMNSVVITLDLAVNAIPIRLLHWIYPLLFGLVYMIFSLLFWAADHNNIIYSVLNWNHPVSASVMCLFLGFVLMPILILIFFLGYHLRLYVHRKTCNVS